MKELNIEQKAKAYDEALEIAKKELQCCGTLDCDAAKQIYRLFPELKESEDERIKKALIRAFKSLNTIKIWNGIERTDILAWLEKQGEQKSTDKIQIGKQYKCIETPLYTTFTIGQVYKPNGKFLCSLMNLCFDCFEPIEDGEQKSTDKVEPKFHEGEWITNGDYTWKIVEVKPLDYILQSQDGNIVDDTISHVDEQFHSFTIEDAKAGDILHSPSHRLIWIYKDNEHYHASINLNYADVVSFDNEIVVPSDVCPANRVQKSILFQKMKESGFEWDAEKKDLRKIDKKYVYEVEPRFKVGEIVIGVVSGILYFITKICNNYYETESGCIIMFSAQDNFRICECNHTWSKEDECTLNGILADYKSMCKTYRNWLESLKNRVQLHPKQEWSEADENYHRICLDLCNGMPNGGVYAPYIKDEAINWLKSFRPQKQ